MTVSTTTYGAYDLNVGGVLKATSRDNARACEGSRESGKKVDSLERY
jgi:hypothetical protein